jgi:prevent-host-death family protein
MEQHPGNGGPMFKTTSVSELRNDLAKVLKEVGREPVVVMSRSRPAAVLVDPETFEALIENTETLSDIVEGRLALAKYLEDPSRAKDAEEVFARLGY